MTVLIIAEKPKMGREIAKALARGPIQSGKNFLTFNGPDGATILSWCIGHLIEMYYPEDYDQRFKKWDLNTLPIVPKTVQFKPVKDKAGQLKTLEGLLKKAHTVVHAGDAGREGQLIVDEILQFFGYRGNVKRLWVKDLVPAAIQQAYSVMQPNSTKRPLCDAAEARQISDWLVGMNMSRAYTLHAGSKLSRPDLLLKYGRVQTPTLRLVVDRTLIRANFVPVDYFIPKISVHKSGMNVVANWSKSNDTGLLKTDPANRLIDQSQAKNLLDAAGDIAQVVSFSEEPKGTAAPKPFTMAALQKECSSKLKLSAKKTLEIAQKLYEAGLISYPRTDCPYMPMSKLQEAPTILRGLAQFKEFLAAVKDCNLSKPSKMFNDEKTGEHWAIIPTSNTQGYKDLKDDEKAVYQLVARNFMAQLHPVRIVLSRKVVFATARGHYEATSSAPIQPGWKKHFGEDEADAERNLPKFERGERLRIMDKILASEKTSPPDPFNDGTLIEAMVSVHKFVTNPEIKKKLQETDGIGTEATRADIIETLISAGYIDRQKKTQLIATPLGIAYIRSLPAPVTDPGLTALWERSLSDVAEGKQKGALFTQQIVAWLENALTAAARLDYAALATVEKKVEKKRSNKPIKDSEVEAWLNVPFGEESKKAGQLRAGFCGASKRWFVPKGRSTEPFKEWM